MLRELAKAGDLHLASDSSTNDGDRSTFAVCISLMDGTTFHLSLHEASELSHDSEHAELCCLLVFLFCISNLLSDTRHASILLYCNNKETIDYASNPFLGTTPR